jgi:diguanylate cyclase (GGDEF)-like protein/PAS domain S-box-containing protein
MAFSNSDRICPISGLAVRRKPAWTDVALGGSFRISAEIIGTHCLLTHNFGEASLEGVKRAFAFTEALIRSEFVAQPYVHILDYTHLRKTTLEGRRWFVRSMHQRHRLALKGIVFYGLSPMLELSTKLSRRLHLIPFSVQIAADYVQAVPLALQMLPASSATANGIGGVPRQVVTRPEWSLNLDDLEVKYELIDSCILHSVSRGYLKDRHLPPLIALREEIFQAVAHAGAPPYMVAGLQDLAGIERRARKHYLANLKSLHRRQPIQRFVCYGLNRFMGAAFNLSRFALPFPAEGARDLSAALAIIDRERRGAPKSAATVSRSEALPPPATASCDASAAIEGLLQHIGAIDWEADGPPREAPADMPAAFHPLYDAIGALKWELDELIREKQEAEAALRRAHTELDQRVRERTADLLDINQRLNREVDERRETEEALRKSEKNYRNLVESVNSIILRWDAQGRIVFLNPYGLDFFGYTAEEIEGRHLIGSIVPARESVSGRDLTAFIANLAREPDSFRINENENIKKDGTRVWIYWNNRAIKDNAGRIVEIMSVGTDLSERRRMESELRRLATTDSLTGVFNRRQFFDKAREEFKRHRRYGHTFVLLLMDLDHFKKINDTYGHPVGDAVLQLFVASCRQVLRQTDIFGRTGGEEFCAILPETRASDAFQVADRLRVRVAGTAIPVEDGAAQFTVSIGLTELQPADESLRSTIRRADRALYAAKGGGRNRVVHC